MELFQLRYFREVVKRGGVLKASAALGVSPPAVSKAISNLEEELSRSLFERDGRNLRLTDEGQHFSRRSEEILTLIEKTRLELGSTSSVSEVVLAGREIFLECQGMKIASAVQKRFPQASVRFLETSGKDALQAVEDGRAHFALTVQPPPPSWGSLSLGTVKSVMAAGRGHPLYDAAKKKKALSIKTVLQYGFASPNLPLFGRTGETASIDGWRDDLHPRKIEFVVESLSVFRKILSGGKALGYVPDYWAKDVGLECLHVEGCSFQFKQTLHCSSKKSKDYSWIASVLSDLKALG